MVFIREILQRLGLSLRKGGGRRFCLPIIALLCAAALGSWFMMRPSEAEWTVNKSWYGDGKSSDFYISTSADLAGLAELVNEKYKFRDFKGKTIHLSADIDLGGKEWVPIGNASYWFSGTFDGGGHSVTGLYINSTSSSQGLFGYIDGAVIKDLSVSGSVTTTAGSAGGIVGGALNSTIITNCASDVSVRGKNNVGGIAGSVDNATFTSCINRGDVVSEAGQYDNGGAGGIAGNGKDAKFYSCANSGSVTAPYKAIGGIIGDAGNTMEVRNCLNLGGVKTENGSAGGIVGYYRSGDSGTSITLCTNMGSVQGATAGGIIGEGIAHISITSCASVGAVSGKYTSGAIAGSGFFTGSDGTKIKTVNISNCVWYENGSVNAGLKSVGDDNDGNFTASMAASADNYDNLAATYAPNPAMSMIPAGKTKTIFRSWPGTSADAVTEVSYDVLPATGLTLNTDVNKFINAAMAADADGTYTVGAKAVFTPSKLSSGGAPESYTTEKMVLLVGEGWNYMPTVYVKQDGTGDGSSWTNAMSGADFSTMLKWISKANNGKAYEFRVAKGTYGQSETLPLPKGVKLYGGFAGNETSIESRSIAGNKTILSRADGLADDNKFSIVTAGAGATSADTRLDGFTVTGGMGTENYNSIRGGGMYINDASPTVKNCLFTDNSVAGNNLGDGGGIYVNDGSPVVENCTFSGNSAQGYDYARGGGMRVTGGGITTVANCTFNGNSASLGQTGAYGGGLYVDGSAVVANCTFSVNRASGYGGGGLAVERSSSVTAANSIFYGNTAGTSGAEVFAGFCTLTLNNCVVKDGGAGTWQGTITSTDIYTGDPKFLSVSPTDNGGAVPTMAVSAGGSAFRKGLKPGATITGADGKTYATPLTDARGLSFDAAVADIGAYSVIPQVKATNIPAFLPVGTSFDITAEVKLKGTTSPDTYAAAALTFSSSNGTVATVSGDRVTGVAAGSTKISGALGTDSYPIGTLVVTDTAPAIVASSDMTDGDGSGVIGVAYSTTDTTKIYDALTKLSEDARLPNGIISIASADAIPASSADISTDVAVSRDLITSAIGEYWDIDASSDKTVQLVGAQSTVNATDPNSDNNIAAPGEKKTIFAKVWRILVSAVKSILGYDEVSQAYLPLRANFTVKASAIPPAARAGITSGDLTKSFLNNVELFTLSASGDKLAARSLADAASADVEKYITVTASGDEYLVSASLMLFNQEGGASGDKKTGAPYVTPLSSDKTSGDFFIVQDGKADEEYKVTMSFAVKTQKINYVTVDGAGDKDGSSWENAMSGADFSAMLKWINNNNAGKQYEFRVAAGTYAQSETLRLPKGVKLYGGFAGTETTAEEIEARDIAKNVTTLSRDAAAASDANFSIVTVGMYATPADTRFDGFTVTGGKNDNGGGMYITYGAPTIANCTFSGNSADSRDDRALGGGMYIIGGSPIIENCIFAGNSAQGYSNAHGGGMYIVEGSPVIENCTFTDNSASHPGTNACGGGMYVRNGSPIVKNSTFSGNSSKYDTARGVGMYLAGSGTTAVVNCTFSGNNAPGGANGGGMCVSDSAGAAVTNCTFSGNSAGTGGGISVQSDANVAAANSVFYGNTASVSGKEISVSTATLTLQNCIAAEGGVTNDKGTITSTDLYTGNPKFLTASPDNNGGTVPTMAISAAGSAYRKGLAPGTHKVGSIDITIPATDARGVSFDAKADIGAYAWQSVTTPAFTGGSLELVVGTSADLAPYLTVKPVSTDIEDKIGRAAAWTSASSDITAVSDGIATGAAKGKTSLSAVFNGTTLGSLPVTVIGAGGDVTNERMTDTPDENGTGSGVIAVVSDTKESMGIYDALNLLSFDRKLPSNVKPGANPIDANSMDITTSVDIYTSGDIRTAVANYLSIDADTGDSPYKVRLIEVNNTVASRTGETLFAKFWRLLTSFFGNADEHADDYLPLQTNFVISEDQLPGHLAYKFGDGTNSNIDYKFTSDDMTSFIKEVNPFVIVKSGDTVEARSLYDIVSGDAAKYITVERTGTVGAEEIHRFTYTIKTRVLLFNKSGAVTEGAGKEFVMPVTLSDDTKTRGSGNYFLVQDGAADEKYDLCIAFAVKTPKVLHVKQNGGANNGKSGDGATWDTALTSMDFAERLRQIRGHMIIDTPYYPADEYGYEFRIASGDYQPVANTGVTGWDTYNFILSSNVKLYGGFAGTEKSLSERKAGNETTLSGMATSTKQTISVVRGSDAKGVIIDGFTIRNGKMGINLIGVTDAGYTNSEVKVKACRIEDNTVNGVLALSATRIEIDSSVIANNGTTASNSQGGGISAAGSAITLKNSTLIGNKATLRGGAVFFGVSPTVKNSTLIAENCTFADNTAGNDGGAVNNSDGSLLLANCTFRGNKATNGGALHGLSTGTKIYNAIFADNSAKKGKDMYFYIPAGTTDNSRIGELVNCRFDSDGINDGSKIISTDCTTAAPLFLTASPDINGGPVPTLAISAGGSAFRSGVKPGTEISGDFKTPMTDARGVSFDTAHADMGAYAHVLESANASVKTDAPKELIIGTSADISKVFSLEAHLKDTTSPDTYAAAFNFASSSSDVISADNGALYILKKGVSDVSVTSAKGKKPDGSEVTFSGVTHNIKTALSAASLDISEKSREIARGGSAVFSIVIPSGYTSADIESRDISWSLTGTGYTITPSSDGLSAKVTANYDSFAKSSDVTAVISGKTSGETKTLTVAVTTPVNNTPEPPVTPGNRTDGAGGESGILDITGTKEDFAIYDAVKDLAYASKLPNGISTDAKPIGATSADVVTSEDIFTKEEIKKAAAEYWNLGASSEDKVQIVEVENTVASRIGEGDTLFAKVWRFIVSLFTGEDKTAPGEGDYLPIQANFTILSSDIASLPDEVKEGLTADNLLSKINLFTVVKESDTVYARSLADAASSDRKAYITVSGDSESGYTVKTRVMLFNMEGGVSGDKTTGAKWVQPLKVTSSDTRPNEKDNYFIVQDGAKDDKYKLCLAFAAKVPNTASVTVTASGDIESNDMAGFTWSVSGDTTVHSADTSSDIMGGEQSVTIEIPSGYKVTLSDETQTLSTDIKTISKDVTWGGEWKITAAFEKIKTERVTLDKSSLVLAIGGSYTLTATVTPSDAYYKNMVWTTSSADIASVDINGKITGIAEGTAKITAKAKDSGEAECTVTVRKSATEDPTVKPSEPGTVKPDNLTSGDIIAVMPEYVTDPASQDEIINIIGLSKDAAVTENGSLTTTGSLVDKAVGEVIAGDSQIISKEGVIVLPIVVSSADAPGKIHALGFKVSGDVFGKVNNVSEIRVVKIFADGHGKAFTVATSSDTVNDKSVALYDVSGDIVAGAIDAEATYTMAAFVKDGGDFDLGKTKDGKVIDPIAIIKQSAPPAAPTPSGSGGGCNAGAGAMALMALIPIALRKRGKGQKR